MNKPILVLYGTVTGNAEICANKAAERLNTAGFNAVVRDIFEMPSHELQNENTLLLCVSTFGEGEPPDTARPMWKALVRDGFFDLSGLRFSVLALGDSSYKEFCQCGKDFDAALERCGAYRLASRVDADVEYEEPCADRIATVIAALRADLAAGRFAGATF